MSPAFFRRSLAGLLCLALLILPLAALGETAWTCPGCGRSNTGASCEACGHLSPLRTSDFFDKQPGDLALDLIREKNPADPIWTWRYVQDIVPGLDAYLDLFPRCVNVFGFTPEKGGMYRIEFPDAPDLRSALYDVSGKLLSSFADETVCMLPGGVPCYLAIQHLNAVDDSWPLEYAISPL